MMVRTSTSAIMFFTLLLFISYAKIASSVDIRLSVPNHRKIIEGSERYRISVVPNDSLYSFPPQFLNKTEDVIYVKNVLPGSKYNIYYYYTNSTSEDLLVWKDVIYTPPNPPTNLTIIEMKNGNAVNITWISPLSGDFSSFSLMLFSERGTVPIQTISLPRRTNYCVLQKLIPGDTYKALLRSNFESDGKTFYTNSDSVLTWTMNPKPPNKFSVSFRNETSLKIMWQALPSELIFNFYKAKIVPSTSNQSSIYIPKNASKLYEATFTNLVPGKVYNISLQTLSKNELSSKLMGKFRTIPLPPSSLTYDENSLTTQSVRIKWNPPNGVSEFDKYEIWIKNWPIESITKNIRELVYEFKDASFVPGRTYQIMMKTLSDKIGSKEISLNVTFRPLPVLDLISLVAMNENTCKISWRPNNLSEQDGFQITYLITDLKEDDKKTVLINSDHQELDISLAPDRNYSISVQSVSNGITSEKVIRYQNSHPLPPIIEEIASTETDLLIIWKPDGYLRPENYSVILRSNTSLTVPMVMNVTNSTLFLTDLYPGSVYNINITAFSHGLASEPVQISHVMNPRPPNTLTVKKHLKNSLLVSWQKPVDSNFSAFLVRYWIEGEDNVQFFRTTDTVAEISGISQGVEYQIGVSTISFLAESLDWARINYIPPPSPVKDVIVTAEDSTKIALQFNRPDGFIDYYSVQLKSNEQTVVKNINHTEEVDRVIRVEVGELNSGRQYHLCVKSAVKDVKSDCNDLIVHTRPLITSDIKIIRDYNMINCLTITYTPTPLGSTNFDKYTFKVSSGSDEIIKYKSPFDMDMKIIFEDLVPGKLYNISAWTEAYNISSKAIVKQDRLYPHPIDIIYAKTITDSAIELLWEKPMGEYDDFQIQYTTPLNVTVQNITKIPYIVFYQLHPSYNYTFQVTVRSGPSIRRVSRAVSAYYMTSESRPNAVEKFNASSIKPNEITLEWQLPITGQNGVLSNYTLTYGIEGSNIYKKIQVSPNLNNETIFDLLPGQNYIFRIQAATKVGYGPAVEFKQTMPTEAPPKPVREAAPRELQIGVETIQIRYDRKYFSAKNGPIIGYSVMVAEDYHIRGSRPRVLNWYDVQSYNMWPWYQAVEPYLPFGNKSIVDFTIGDEDCYKRLTKGFCNGPLRGRTTYYVKIRVFTASDKFVDTEYSLPITTKVDQRLLQGQQTPFKFNFVDCAILFLVIGITLTLSIFFLIYQIISKRTLRPSQLEDFRQMIHNVQIVNESNSIQREFDSRNGNEKLRPNKIRRINKRTCSKINLYPGGSERDTAVTSTPINGSTLYDVGNENLDFNL